MQPENISMYLAFCIFLIKKKKNIEIQDIQMGGPFLTMLGKLLCIGRPSLIFVVNALIWSNMSFSEVTPRNHQSYAGDFLWNSSCSILHQV